jgi:hypothetical protein
MSRTRSPASRRLIQVLASTAAVLALTGCLGGAPRPLGAIDAMLERSGPTQNPSLAGGWLAVIVRRGGRDQVQLVDIERLAPVPLPGLNRPDALPLAVSVDQRGDRLALVRAIGGRTDVVLYRRRLGSLEPIPLQPSGVAGQVSLSADGRHLAVEVRRDGLRQVDLIRLP